MLAISYLFYSIVTCIDHCGSRCIFYVAYNWKNIWWKDLSFVVSALSENAPETSKRQPWKIVSVDFCLFIRIYKIVSFVLNCKERFNSSHILEKKIRILGRCDQNHDHIMPRILIRKAADFSPSSLLWTLQKNFIRMNSESLVYWTLGWDPFYWIILIFKYRVSSLYVNFISKNFISVSFQNFP